MASWLSRSALRSGASGGAGPLVSALLCVLQFGQPLWALSDIAVEKTVNDPTLMPGAAVEFTVTVRNLGPDATNAAQVTDRLPPELAIPPGTAAFVSQGFYDAVSGRWLVDELAAGASATLVVPAQVTAAAVPPCVVNEAVADRLADDPEPANDRALAALRLPQVERCVDLAIAQSSFMLTDPFCAESSRVLLQLSLSNHGPDPARQVHIAVSDTPNVIPGLAFDDPLCGSDAGATCLLEELDAGATVLLSLRSQEFKNSSGREVTVTASVYSPDPELVTGHERSVQTWFVRALENCIVDVDLGSGAGAGACFIATAAYGSALHPHVATFRRFRDRYLLTHSPGRAFVAAYYRLSPPLAAIIAERPALRALVRAVLWPLFIVIRSPVAVLVSLAAVLWLRRCCIKRNARRDRRPGGNYTQIDAGSREARVHPVRHEEV